MTYETIPLPSKAKKISGQCFGRLTAITPVGHKKVAGMLWLCICECGSDCVVVATKLISGHTKSCGCFSGQTSGDRLRTHGMTETKEFMTWRAMIQRCEDSRGTGYRLYGGRGISVCTRWRNSFIAFYDDMGDRPSPKHSIDRIDNDGNYTPSNCRWATRIQQGRNTRANHMITYEGRTHCLVKWSEIRGIHRNTLSTRLLRGWTVERALTTP